MRNWPAGTPASDDGQPATPAPTVDRTIAASSTRTLTRRMLPPSPQRKFRSRAGAGTARRLRRGGRIRDRNAVAVRSYRLGAARAHRHGVQPGGCGGPVGDPARRVGNPGATGGLRGRRPAPLHGPPGDLPGSVRMAAGTRVAPRVPAAV